MSDPDEKAGQPPVSSTSPLPAENLTTRIGSALVLAILALALTVLGGAWFRLLAVAGAAVLYYEWSLMARLAASRGQIVAGGALLGLFLLFLLFGAGAVTTLSILIAFSAVLFVNGLVRRTGLWPAGGFVYAATPALAISLLRGDTAAGLAATIFLFAAVWATDIAAYFTGRRFGGPKLAPAISPSKTWSGALGGAAGAVAAGMAVALVAGASVSFVALLVLTLFVSVTAQVGDLFESAIKRRHKVKDSSHLIPGHGGVMDRIDGLVAAAVALCAAGALAAGLDDPSRAFFMP